MTRRERTQAIELAWAEHNTQIWDWGLYDRWPPIPEVDLIFKRHYDRLAKINAQPVTHGPDEYQDLARWHPWCDSIRRQARGGSVSITQRPTRDRRSTEYNVFFNGALVARGFSTEDEAREFVDTRDEIVERECKPEYVFFRENAV